MTKREAKQHIALFMRSRKVNYNIMGYYRKSNRDVDGNIKMRHRTALLLIRLQYLQHHGDNIRIRTAARWAFYYIRTARACQACDLPMMVRSFMFSAKQSLRILRAYEVI